MEKYLNLLQKEEFTVFYKLLQQGNAVCNLTTIIEEKEVYHKHFLDSILPEALFTQGAKCIEIGSGAGFPSIPLMLIRKDLHFTLVESIQKKVNFLKKAVEQMQLNAEVVENRAEVLAHLEVYREKFDICTARAVAKMVTLVEYCLPFLKVGGKLIAYKANVEEELQEAEYAITLLGGKIEQKIEYTLPNGMGNRVIVVIKKIKETPQKYPRGKGKERSKPLLKKKEVK